MSHTILYRAMFVKMHDGTFIPMIESGDNNTWDADNRRRVREWSPLRWNFESEEQKSRYALTEKEILSLAQREINKTLQSFEGKAPAFGGAPYTKETILKDISFFNCLQVYGHSTTSASQLLNFIKSGFRNAVTMEDLKNAGCHIRFALWDKDELRTESVQDEEELARKWAEYRSKGLNPDIGLDYGCERVWREMKERTHKPTAKRTAPEGSFIISFRYAGSERFMVKLTSRNILYNPYPEHAHKYASLKVAQKTRERIAQRFNQISDIRILNTRI